MNKAVLVYTNINKWEIKEDFEGIKQEQTSTDTSVATAKLTDIKTFGTQARKLVDSGYALTTRVADFYRFLVRVSMAVNTIDALSTEVFFHADFHILTFLWLTFILLDITLSSWVQPTTSGQPVRIPDGPRWKATAAAPGAPTNRLFDCLYL